MKGGEGGHNWDTRRARDALPYEPAYQCQASPGSEGGGAGAGEVVQKWAASLVEEVARTDALVLELQKQFEERTARALRLPAEIEGEVVHVAPIFIGMRAIDGNNVLRLQLRQKIQLELLDRFADERPQPGETFQEELQRISLDTNERRLAIFWP